MLVEVARIVVDMYSGVLGGISKSVDKALFKDLGQTVDNQISLLCNLNELKGQLEIMGKMTAIVGVRE